MKTHVPIFLLLFLSACGNSTSDVQSDDSATEQDSGSATAPEVSDNNSPDNPMTMINAPATFYWNYDANKGMEAPEVLTKEETIQLMKDLPNSDGNFLGLKLSDEGIVQFMYQDGRGLVLDIPTVEEPVDEVIDLEKCIQIITDVYAGKSADDIAASYN